MKHDSPEFADIAERGTILRCQVGSGLHGTAVSGQDDRDEMGISVEPPEYVIGLNRFEQYIYRTQPEGHRSGPGDLDLIVYSPRKWMRLALAGNPTVLLPLFVPEREIVRIDDFGRQLRANADMIVSRQAGHRFLGYLRAQREITLPIPQPWLTWLRDLRQGRHTKDEALQAATELEHRLEKLITSSPLPETPDLARANDWLVRAYQEAWRAKPA